MPSKIRLHPPKYRTLSTRLQHAPASVLQAMQDHAASGGEFQRGMVAAMDHFFAVLEDAGLAPEQVTEDVFRQVGTSRSRFRTLIAGLRVFAPSVPLAPSFRVKQDWDQWLNATYNKKPKVERKSPRVGLPPEQWPGSWQVILPKLDRSVRAYGERFRKPAPKTRDAVISVVGLLARAREWARANGVHLSHEPNEELFEAFLCYLASETDTSFRSAKDYFERLRIFFLRGELLDEDGLGAIVSIMSELHEEATDEDPEKWLVLRKFRKKFDLTDVLKHAVAAADAAKTTPAHTTKAFRLRQKAMIYALLVNTGDRQGDIRSYRIGIDLLHDEHFGWHHAIRQEKTKNTKELEALWPGTSSLIDAHILGDRPVWMINEMVQDLEGMNLLTLGENVLNDGFINRRLGKDFEISGHLVRTLIADLIRRERPDAIWALQHMLGHSDRYTQAKYRSDFDESRAVKTFDELCARIDSGVGWTSSR